MPKKIYCSRCKQVIKEDSWLEPFFGKYRGKSLCGKCDEELRSHKLYHFRQKISVHVVAFKIFLELLIGDFINLFRKRKHYA